MVRDPCYLIEKWHQNNWVDRIGSDHRDFHICFNLNNYNLPWFAKDFCYEYIQSNSIERSILTIYHIFSKIIQKPECSKKEYNDKTLFVFFEDFVKEPEVYINLICKKLNTRRSKEFEGLLKKLSLPRKKVPNELSLKEFTQKYKNEISKDILMKLDHLYNIYEDFYNKYKVI